MVNEDPFYPANIYLVIAYPLDYHSYKTTNIVDSEGAEIDVGHFQVRLNKGQDFISSIAMVTSSCDAACYYAGRWAELYNRVYPTDTEKGLGSGFHVEEGETHPADVIVADIRKMRGESVEQEYPSNWAQGSLYSVSWVPHRGERYAFHITGMVNYQPSPYQEFTYHAQTGGEDDPDL